MFAYFSRIRTGETDEHPRPEKVVAGRIPVSRGNGRQR